MSLREALGLVTIIALAVAYAALLVQFRSAERELQTLRAETGFLPPTGAEQIAAVHVPSDEALEYRVRVRVPEDEPYRIAYSSVVPQGRADPEWFAAVDVPPGDSVVTVRVGKDPRDERWKIATLVQSGRGNKRMATGLPEDHIAVFRESGDVVSTGVGRSMVSADSPATIRLVDERWLVGEGALLLYGDRPAERDQVGIYAELQPDTQPL